MNSKFLRSSPALLARKRDLISADGFVSSILLELVILEIYETLRKACHDVIHHPELFYGCIFCGLSVCLDTICGRSPAVVNEGIRSVQRRQHGWSMPRSALYSFIWKTFQQERGLQQSRPAVLAASTGTLSGVSSIPLFNIPHAGKGVCGSYKHV